MALHLALSLCGMIPTYVRIVVFFLQSSQNICRWPLSQVLVLDLDLEGLVLDLDLDSCRLDCISVHILNLLCICSYILFISFLIYLFNEPGFNALVRAYVDGLFDYFSFSVDGFICR